MYIFILYKCATWSCIGPMSIRRKTLYSIVPLWCGTRTKLIPNPFLSRQGNGGGGCSLMSQMSVGISGELLFHRPRMPTASTHQHGGPVIDPQRHSPLARSDTSLTAR